MILQWTYCVYVRACARACMCVYVYESVNVYVCVQAVLRTCTSEMAVAKRGIKFKTMDKRTTTFTSCCLAIKNATGGN